MLTCTQLFKVSFEILLLAKATELADNNSRTYYLNGFCCILFEIDNFKRLVNVEEVDIKSFYTETRN